MRFNVFAEITFEVFIQIFKASSTFMHFHNFSQIEDFDVQTKVAGSFRERAFSFSNITSKYNRINGNA